jgi:hypothetical protein
LTRSRHFKISFGVALGVTKKGPALGRASYAVMGADQRAAMSEHVEISENLGGEAVDQRHRQVDQMHEYRRLLGSKPLR